MGATRSEPRPEWSTFTRTACVDATGLGQSAVAFGGTERQRGGFWEL